MLPAPRPDTRVAALRLLGAIGHIQASKGFYGKPSCQPSVRLAVPAIRTALRDPILQPWACQTLEDNRTWRVRPLERCRLLELIGQHEV